MGISITLVDFHPDEFPRKINSKKVVFQNNLLDVGYVFGKSLHGGPVTRNCCR